MKKSMTPWRLRLFGGVVLEDSKHQPITLPTKAGQLLALLALRPDESVGRNHVATTLWPDADLFEARNRLNVTLSRLRSSFNADECPLDAEKLSLRLPSHRVASDLQEFRTLRKRAREAPADTIRVQFLRDALLLAEGEFMAGHEEPWIEHERRRMAKEVVDTASYAAEIVGLYGDPEGAVAAILKAATAVPDHPEMSRIVGALPRTETLVDQRLFDEERRRHLPPPVPRTSEGRKRWDVAADFDPGFNPDGAWSYGWTWDVGQPFSLFRVCSPAHLYPGYAVRLRSTAWPHLNVWSNASDSPVGFNEFAVLPGQFTMHPGPHGQKCVVRWTAPGNVACRVHARFYAISPHATVDVHLLIANTIVATGDIEPGHREVCWRGKVELREGETIEAMVGPSDDGYLSDSTGLELTIETH